MKLLGVSRHWLAARFGWSKSRVQRKCDPLDGAVWTMADLLLVGRFHPALYHEIVRRLVELGADAAGQQLAQPFHVQRAGGAFGEVCRAVQETESVDAIDKRLRRRLDRAWHEVELTAVLARRDLRRVK